jgi:3-hydroxyisobutyrate dehydrogenase-like beta-hydroxyacid dehydrogenase
METGVKIPGASRSAPLAVIGLGRMGSRIARVLAREGSSVAAWNRTAPDPEVWAHSGVTLHRDAGVAVRDAALVIAVPFAYENTREALASVAEDGALRGKVLINLSWGSLLGTADMQRWCRAAGAEYLDGALLCYPDELGGDGGRIVVSGSPAAAADVLAALAPLGPVQYLGEDPAAANAVGTAVGAVFYHAALAAFYEAIAFSSRFGVEPEALLPEIRRMLDLLSTHVEVDIATIRSGRYDEPSATVDVQLEGVRMAACDLASVGQPSPLMRGFLELVGPLAEAGHGDGSIARLYDVLRSQPGAGLRTATSL